MSSLDAELFARRLMAAEQYFNALVQYASWEWEMLYMEYKSKNLVFPRSYALLWPARYVELGVSQEKICGKRTYAQTPSRGLERCQSVELWGYECGNSREKAPHADHLFPYGLGGITDSRNQIYLCERHNWAKASDFHLYPWEKGEQGWVGETIERINDEMVLLR